MNQLTQYLVDGILNEGEDSLGGVALFGGGFKPPTNGHLEVVLQGLKENPEVKQVQILVGSGERNGVTQEESIKIWEIYKRFIPVSTQIIKVQSPFSYIKTYLQDHQDENVYIFIGARSGNEADDKDVAKRSAYAKKYSDKAIPVEIITTGGVSGTKARQAALSGNNEEFITFFPEQLTDSEREEIIQMISSVIKEVKLPINENASYSKEIDVKEKIDQLTQHMLDKGYNIEPLPTVEFVNGDSDNARDFFGKTAYYNPNNNTIVLYTEGRHPKDIVRSFAHEMIHHIQNLENRLGDVSTTNTMEDDNIDKLEQEANLKGTMTFRNWTDSLNENKQINYTNPNFNTEWEEAIRYPEFKEMGKDGWLKIANQGKPVSYSSIKDKLGNVDLDFEGLEEPKKQRFLDAFKKGTIEMPIAVKFSDNDYDLVAGNTRLSGLVKNGEDPKIWIVNIGSINEYDNSGPTTPKVYIVKDDGTYKEAPIKLLSKISNLTYDMGGGETNYYPEKNIVIVDNIPVEEFAKEPGDIKGEKVYVEYNLNNPTSLPKANKIIASQLVYHLDNREAFAQTVANSLKDGGTFEFQSDLMNKKDKMFLQHLSDEYGFGLPTKLNQYKQESLPLKKGEFVEPIISYIYKITDKDGKTATLSTTKKGKWWEYEKIDGDLDFKTGKFSTPPIYPDPDFRDKKYTLRTFDKYLSFFGDSNTIVDFEKLNEANKPYKHKHGFDDKLGKDPFGLNQYARELAQGLEEAIIGDKIKEAKEEVTDSMVVVLSRNDNQINLYNLKTNEALGSINTYGNEVTGVAAKKGYGPLMYELGMANIYPNGLQSDRRGNTEPAAEVVWEKYIAGASPHIKVEKLTPKDKEYRTEYPNGNEIWDVDGFYNYKFYNPNTATLKQLIQKGNTLSDELRKKIILDNDKLYNDLVNEAIVGDKIECDNCGWSWDIKDGGDDLFICHKCGHDNTPKQLNEGRYDTLTNKLSSIAFEAFKDIHDRGDKEGSFKFRVDNPDDEHDIPSEDFYFDFEGVVEITDDEYGVDGGANAGFDNEGEEIPPLLSVKFKIPQNPTKNPSWEDISFDIKDVVRHELEHLTQDGDNENTGKYMKDDQLIRDLIDADLLSKSQYFKLEKEVDAMLQGLYFKAKKSKRPFGDVIDDYLNIFLDQETISPQEKEDILNTWRSRRKALSLPVFEQENMEDKYKIYLDMDGVIVDFDKRFTDLAGMGPREYENSFGKDKFWDFIDSKEKGGGVGFWVGMPWMPGGPELYNRVAQHNHALLSSPSRSESSKLGKRLWKKKYTPNTDLILSLAANKKNYADGNSILIDDRESNIQQWREAGGIGILYKSADQVNKELDKLGL